jgi:uncharacterized protein YndB with AHSA1/START domain
VTEPVEPIEIEFEVACSPEHAFDTWANKTSAWWPRSHSMTSAPGLAVTFEPRPGGRIFERTPEGAEHDWGEILAWEPPHRLAYLWHLGTDRTRATEVDISFTGGASATTVTITHRGWERLGADAPAWRQRNLGGWSGLLPHFRQAAAAPADSGAPDREGSPAGEAAAPVVHSPYARARTSAASTSW